MEDGGANDQTAEPRGVDPLMSWRRIADSNDAALAVAGSLIDRFIQCRCTVDTVRVDAEALYLNPVLLR
jgi:hypothetical protein